jgi:hypothetical protein
MLEHIETDGVGRLEEPCSGAKSHEVVVIASRTSTATPALAASRTERVVHGK